MRSGRLALVALVAAWTVGAQRPDAVAFEPVHPGKTWASKAPGEVGLDAAKLKAFTDFTGGRGCVTRYGYVVHTWGDHTKTADVASACKPFFSHFLFKALEDRKIPRLDEKVVKYEPRLGELNASLGHKDRDITWRHLATQTSCYQVSEKPGSAYCYNDWQMALFWDTLFGKVYGVAARDVNQKVFRPLLAEPLGFEDGGFDRGGRVSISPRDFCRFGLLYMRQGRWGETQVLNEDAAVAAVGTPLPADLPRAGRQLAEMIPGQRSIGSDGKPDNQCPHEGSYSFLWWVNGTNEKGARLWPDVPEDAFGAFGHGGPRAMVVVPSLGLVVSWNDASLRGWEKVGQALKRLVDSVSEGAPGPAASRQATAAGKPMPGQIVVDPKNPAWLVRYDRAGNHKPFFMCGPGDPEGFLYRGTRRPDGTRDGDQLALIEKLKPTGANCIYLQAIRSHGGDGDKTHNPFVDNDPANGLNAKVLDQWETWFAKMDEAGIVIYFFLYDDSAAIWKTGDEVGPAERAFIEGLVNRFKHHRHVIWCVAEEYQERFSARRVSNIAAVIRAADEHHHPIAVHKLSGLDFREFAEDPNIDQFAIQHNAKTADQLHAGMVKAFGEAKGRYSLNMSEAAGHGTGETARRNTWACAMGGAHVMVLGMDIAGTSVSDLEDCGRLVRLFESKNVTAMAPHDELAAGATQYVLATPGQAYIAYSASATGPMGLKAMTAGVCDFTWLDCASGATVQQQGVRVADGDQAWDRPQGIGAEAVVYVRRRREVRP